MYFMGETKLPEGLLPPPDTRTWQERGADNRAQFGEIVSAMDDQRVFAENVDARENARLEAYDQRVAIAQEVAGVKLINPMRRPRYADGKVGFDGELLDMAAVEARFDADLQKLGAEKLDVAERLARLGSVDEQARNVTRSAVSRADAAMRNARDIGPDQKLWAELFGSGFGSVKDSVGMPLTFVGGGAGAGRTVFGRILHTVLTEGAIAGGGEALVQSASEDYQREAGVYRGDFWKNVGLAAAFGGGLGGLVQGGGEFLARTGRATAETDAALARMAAGDVSEADARLIADAAGVKVDEGDMASLTRAMEADADTAAVLRPEVDERQLADAVRAIETDAPLPRVLDEVDETHVPPGLRKTQQTEGQIPDNASSISAPDIQSFVDSENAARLSRLEDFVAMNEADIAHLRDDGALDAMPSERDFSNVRGASDEHRASIVLAELENKVAKTKAEIAAGPKHSVDDAAAQIAYAKQQPQVLVQPELRTSKLAVPASAEAVEVAAQKLVAAGGVKPARKAKPEKVDFGGGTADYGGEKKISPEIYESYKEYFDFWRTATDAQKSKGFEYDMTEWKDVGRGYAVSVGRNVPRQEIRTPEGNIIVRGIDTEGGTFEEFEMGHNPFEAGGMDWIEAAIQELQGRAGWSAVLPAPKPKPADIVKRDTLDIMDALPGGTDANGNPISTTHAELSDTATRMNDLADLIASCKA
jgi:hypothetical protein